MYEGGIREPLIARWPGKIPAGKTTDHVSVQFDLMATLSELTGVKALPNDGVSFLPTLMGKEKNQKKHDFLYFEFPEKTGQVAIRIGNWKGVKSNMKKDRNASWEIYNLATDVNETTDVAAQHLELVKQMEVILKREHQSSHIKDWEFVDPKFSAKE